MTRHLAQRILSILACLATFSAVASAHERWVHHDLIRPFDRTLFDTVCSTNLLTGLAVLALLFWLARFARSPRPAWIPRPSGRLLRLLGAWSPVVLRVAYGITLIVFALRGQYLAPDLRAGDSTEGQLLIGSAAAVGLLLVAGFRTREAALFSILVFLWAAVRRPFEAFDLSPISAFDVLCYGEVLGIGAYLALVRPERAAADRWRREQAHLPPESRHVGLALNRVALGATLCVLGAIKFLRPELFMGVVQNYPEIFHLPFEDFFGTSEEEVVFGASVIELTLGLCLLFGLYTRVVVVVLAGVFVTTALLFQEEVVGHLPLIGMVLVLLIEGGGSLRPLRELLVSLRGDPGRLARLAPVVEARGPLRRYPAFLVTVAAVGLAFGATLYGSQPTLMAGEPWNPILDADNPSGVFAGHRGRCSLAIELVPREVRLNELFGVRTTVRDAETGEIVDDVSVEVDITMPQHGHGMPTAPRTRRVWDGRWVTEGCKLHMFGRWLIQVRVLRDGEPWDRISTTYDFQPRPRT